MTKIKELILIQAVSRLNMVVEKLSESDVCERQGIRVIFENYRSQIVFLGDVIVIMLF